MLGEDAGRLAMALVAHQLGQVLMQLAAVEHVEDLHAAADRQHRQLAVERGPEQRELCLVPAPLDDRRLGMLLGAVQSRVEVGAAREDQTIDRVERLLDRVVVRRDQQRPGRPRLRPTRRTRAG